MAEEFAAVHEGITINIIKFIHCTQIEVFNRLARNHQAYNLLLQLQAALLRLNKVLALLSLRQVAIIIDNSFIRMIAVEAAGNIKINKPARLQLAKRIADGLHRDTRTVRAARAVKACAYEAALAKGSNTDSLLAQRLIEACRAMRATLHHLAVNSNRQLRLADAAMNKLRRNNIQHCFMNSAGLLHLLQLVLALHHTQILQHAVEGAKLLKSKILMQHTLPIQGCLLRFDIHHLRRTAIKGCCLTEAVHRTDIAEVRLIAGTLKAAAYPENSVLRTNQQHALLYRTREVIHCHLMINCRHLPSGMRCIHRPAKALQARLQLACRHRTQSFS